MQTRSQTRVANAQSAIWYPNDEFLADDATRWAEQQHNNGRICEIIKDKAQCFVGLSADAKLYLLCHGYTSNELSSPKSPNTMRTLQKIEYTPVSSKADPEPQSIEFDSNQLADHLMAQGLSKEHKMIEMAACYSNEFAKCLQQALCEQGYKDLAVYGYYRSFIEPDEDSPHGLANLEGEDILDDEGKLTNTFVPKNINKYFDARLVKVCYGLLV